MKQERDRGELGQGLVEFAVIFPIFIFLIAIVFDVALGFNRQATIQHAVREGARLAALSDDCQVIRDLTSDQSQGLLDAVPGEIDFAYPEGDDEGDPVNVSASYDYNPIFLRTVAGLFQSDVDSPFTINVTGSARLEADMDACT